MKADIELLFLPYAGAAKGSVADVLIRELHSRKWTCFRAAVAFARESGNFRELLDALVEFAASGARLEMTFGANTFADGEGSDYAAIETLLDQLEEFPNARLHLYSEPDRTFHPKMYLLSNETEAFLLIGSSNWTQGGLVRNVEANVIVRLALEDAEQREAFEEAAKVFATKAEHVKTDGGRVSRYQRGARNPAGFVVKFIRSPNVFNAVEMTSPANTPEVPDIRGSLTGYRRMLHVG